MAHRAAGRRDWGERASELPTPVRLVALLGCFVDRRHGQRFYAKAVNAMRRVRAAYDTALGAADLLAMPTVPFTAPAHPPADRSVEEDFAAASRGTVSTGTGESRGRGSSPRSCCLRRE